MIMAMFLMYLCFPAVFPAIEYLFDTVTIGVS